MDARHGKDLWRPYRRFVIWQHHNSKWRAIDDGTASGHNEAVSSATRVHTSEPAWAAAVARRFSVRNRHLLESWSVPGHLPSLNGGCDDEKSAYRWKGVSEGDRCLNIVAYWDNERRRVMFVELWGHPFGLKAAVETYNRDPELHVAVMRTLLFTPCSHFYDDRLTIDLDSSRGSGQRAYRDLCSLTGKVLDQEKHARMAPCVVYTGCELRLDEVVSDSCLTLAPKPGRLEKISALIHAVLQSGTCSPAQAATILGKCGFVGSQLQGRILRFADRPLIERQHSKDPDVSVTDRLRACLSFILEAFARLQPKSIPLSMSEPVVVIYADAAFTPGSPISGMGGRHP